MKRRAGCNQNKQETSMRLKNEGKTTSKLWLVGGAVGAVALAAAASMLAGTPREAATANTAPAANAASAEDEHSAGDGHDHAAENNAAASNAAAQSTPAAKNAATNAAPPPTAKPAAGRTTVTSGKVRDIQGMKVEDLRVGTGKEAKNGTTVSVDYRGTLQDGTVFDESYKRGQTFDFQLPGQVIQGWNLGVVGMKEGGKRRLTIPSNLAYGPQGSPPTIPPHATLIFEIELRKVS
jgi:FKBP-type peptidyl-prolyl cis-trans isomerase